MFSAAARSRFRARRRVGSVSSSSAPAVPTRSRPASGAGSGADADHAWVQQHRDPDSAAGRPDLSTPAGPVPARADALGPVLAELPALDVAMQPVQVDEPLPTSPLPEQSPELHGRPQPRTSTVAVLAEPVPDQPETPVPPTPRPELRANQLCELLERLRAGGQPVHRGQQLTELNVNGSRRGTVDDRTVRSLVNSRWLLERDGAMHLTPAAVALLDTRARAMR